jgi:hypothetical protein
MGQMSFSLAHWSRHVMFYTRVIGSPNLPQQQLAALLRGQRKKGFKCGQKAAKEGLHGFPVPTNNQGSERYHQTQKPLRGHNFHFVISESLKQKKRKKGSGKHQRPVCLRNALAT